MANRKQRNKVLILTNTLTHLQTTSDSEIVREKSTEKIICPQKAGMITFEYDNLATKEDFDKF